MTKKSRWIWFLLFVCFAAVLGLLATVYNFVVVREYYRTLEFPWFRIVLGTIGFLVTLSGMVLFFLRLLKEMKLNQLQSEFIATVSHELKTPIATIGLTSSLLREGGISEEERARLWKSHDEELKRLNEEVATLLEAARWQATPPRVRLKEVRLEEWLSGSLTRWRGILGPGAELQREGEPLDCDAKLDVATLDLITNNLVDNARKFSKDRPQLTVSTHVLPARNARQPGRWEIRFEDRGWGFDPSDSKKIFTRFYRAHSNAPYAIPGTGLGLYLASSACRAMGLKLKGTSLGRGQGATFVLEGKSS